MLKESEARILWFYLIHSNKNITYLEWNSESQNSLSEGHLFKMSFMKDIIENLGCILIQDVAEVRYAQLNAYAFRVPEGEDELTMQLTTDIPYPPMPPLPRLN